jgi:hypothetical protein
MHKLFSDWLEDAGLDVKSLPLQEWWLGLEEYCADLHRRSLLELLGFATKGDAVEALVPTGLREALKAKDGTFKMRDNTFLVIQLARVAVRILFDNSNTDHDLGQAAALGMIVGSFGQDVTEIHKEHIQAAGKYLSGRAQERRVRPQMKRVDAPTAAEFSKTVQNVSSFELLQAPLISIATTLSNVSANLSAVSSHLTIQDEELNVLWWLFGETSRDFQKPFRSFGRGPAAIIAASELADLLAFPPAPVSSESFLRQTLRSKDDTDPPPTTTLLDALKGIDKDWKQARATAVLNSLEDFNSLCPLHLILMKTCEAKQEDDWPALIRASCGVRSDLALDSILFALQVLQERMFSSALKAVAEANA